LHIACNPETHLLPGERQFALMKPASFVINTTRGAVIDEAALVRALQTRRIAGAGLDFFEREPHLEPGLCELENVVLAPHLGSATIGTRTKTGMIVWTISLPFAPANARRTASTRKCRVDLARELNIKTGLFS
jgi:glyoxylate reductase